MTVERLALPRRHVTAAERRLDVTCRECGRTESMTALCSYCFLGRTPEQGHRAGVVDWAVRAAAINAVGWESPVLAFEVRRHPTRTVHDAAEAGYTGSWPPLPTRTPRRAA